MRKMKLMALGVTTLALTFGAMAQDITTLKGKALLYLPMEKSKIMEFPAAEALAGFLGGKPVFAKGKKGEALVIDGEGVSVKGIKITGANLIKGEQGTIAFWMKPLLPYPAGKVRHTFFSASETNGHFIYLEGQTFYFQTVNGGKYISPNFNFDWNKQSQWSTETWYHVAVTWAKDKDTLIYINGVRSSKRKVASRRA